MEVQGYKKKTKAELQREINGCVSISQLCALVQHEGIVIQMRSMQGASNIPRKKLTAADFVPNQSPLDKLKRAVLEALEQQR